MILNHPLIKKRELRISPEQQQTAFANCDKLKAMCAEALAGRKASRKLFTAAEREQDRYAASRGYPALQSAAQVHTPPADPVRHMIMEMQEF